MRRMTTLVAALVFAGLLNSLCALAEPTERTGKAPSADAAPPVRVVPVMGRVTWPGHDLSAAQVRIYADPQQTKLLEIYPCGGPTGAFVLALPPGSYYVMVVSDQDGDKKPSAGDGLGFYGVTDPESRPQELVIDEGSDVLSLVIPISFQIGEGGRLEPVAVEALPLGGDTGAQVSGHVTGLPDTTSARYALLIPVGPQTPPQVAAVSADGAFSLTASPGGYYLLAVEDLNDSGSVDCGDLFGLLDYEPSMGPSLPVLRLSADHPVSDVSLDLRWALDSEARLRTGDGDQLGPRVQLATFPAVCAGTVTRLGRPVADAQVRLYADESLTRLCRAVHTDAEGRYVVAVPAASYVLAAVRDVNGDREVGAGDEVGFLGVDEGNLAAKPQRLSLRAGELRSGTALPLVAVIDAEGKPTPLKAGETGGEG